MNPRKRLNSQGVKGDGGAPDLIPRQTGSGKKRISDGKDKSWVGKPDGNDPPCVEPATEGC